ncbi:MAG TPA: hypothetical protein VLX68_17480 [Chitinivibrionales bacterium]|nr:hypothetical protein [Chitinivibrionales bacterium]
MVESGLVGIGNTSPGTIDGAQLKLDVTGYAGFNGLRVGLDGSNDILADSANGLTITSKNASAKMQFKTGGTSNIRMTIDSGGNVGIGQTNPGSKLDVAGALTLEPTNTPANPASSAEGRIYIRNNKLIIQYNDAGTIRYKYLALNGTGVTWVHTTTAP